MTDHEFINYQKNNKLISNEEYGGIE
ncbi:hypothetical [Yersinia pestis KIM10+]|uniref:Uncharacterized protein n=1 Tax=Yersinia pestis TaxID=632 RepID=Q8CLL9_YERPE|nr:hypothetical [Yersinia pestis KIM10+]